MEKAKEGKYSRCLSGFLYSAASAFTWTWKDLVRLARTLTSLLDILTSKFNYNSVQMQRNLRDSPLPFRVIQQPSVSAFCGSSSYHSSSAAHLCIPGLYASLDALGQVLILQLSKSGRRNTSMSSATHWSPSGVVVLFPSSRAALRLQLRRLPSLILLIQIISHLVLSVW